MKNLILVPLVILFAFSSCTVSLGDEDLEPVIDVIELNLSVSTSEDSATLTWDKVEECSWYKILIAKKGETLEVEANYQNLNVEEFSYEVNGLDSKTEYDIKVEGTSYLDDGKILAEKSMTVSTK